LPRCRARHWLRPAQRAWSSSSPSTTTSVLLPSGRGERGRTGLTRETTLGAPQVGETLFDFSSAALAAGDTPPTSTKKTLSKFKRPLRGCMANDGDERGARGSRTKNRRERSARSQLPGCGGGEQNSRVGGTGLRSRPPRGYRRARSGEVIFEMRTTTRASEGETATTDCVHGLCQRGPHVFKPSSSLARS